MTSENATMKPPAMAPIGFPKPPTIAEANIGSSSEKYTNGLKDLSKP